MTALAVLATQSDTAPFLRVLLALVVVLAVGRAVGAVFVRLGQPIVIGEIIAGIALGPSLLGLLPGGLDQRLFPAEVLPYLSVISQLGIVLFMFVIGLELDITVVRRSGGRAAAISLTSILLPFGLGVGLLAPVLFDRYPPSPASDGTVGAFGPFALFIGVSICGSAFAILARVLAERDMFAIPLGATLIACAAIDDVAVFTLLALTTAVAAGGGLAGVAVTLAQLIVVIIVLVTVVRPLLARWVLAPFTRTGRVGAEQMAIVFLCVMGSAAATSWIGVSELIGAFLCGAIMPRPAPSGSAQAAADADMLSSIAGKVEGISVQLLLPVFFVVAGQGVVLGGLDSRDLLPAVLVLGVATLGKFAGGATAARLTGVSTRQSLAVGTLLNTRGLAELVVLGLARDSGVIGTEVYTMLVMTTVATTVGAGPILRWVYPDRILRRDIAEAQRTGNGAATDRAVVWVDRLEGPEDFEELDRLIDLAVAFGGARATSEVTLVHYVSAAGGFGAVAERLGVLQPRRARCEAAGVPCSVVCRPSAQPLTDLATEVRRIAPDAVLAHGTDADLIAVVTGEGADLVTVHGPLEWSQGLCVVGGSSRTERAATELGVRLALHAGVPVHIVTASERLRRRLQHLGVALAVDRAPAALAVTGTSDDGVLRVEAGDRDRPSIHERLGPWRVGEVLTPLSSR